METCFQDFIAPKLSQVAPELHDYRTFPVKQLGVSMLDFLRSQDSVTLNI